MFELDQRMYNVRSQCSNFVKNEIIKGCHDCELYSS